MTPLNKRPDPFFLGAPVIELNRRRWLSVAAGAIPSASAWEASAWEVGLTQDSSATLVVDTHLHCFAGKDPRFPYHPLAPYRPDDVASPEHLLECMDGASVDYAIVVHPEPYQEDHRYLQHCLDVGDGRLKGTCLFFADRPGFSMGMQSLVKRNRGRIIAARIHAYAPNRLPPFGSQELRQFWRTASELGLAIQLHFEPRYAPGFEALIREFADTTVIIDHLGRPMQGTIEEHDVVVGWSRFPNTMMKVSSIPDQNQYPHREVQPVIRKLTDAFGADRMIYGGGFKAAATAESYRAYRENVEGLLSHLPAADRAKVLGQNAARLFRFA